MTTGLRSGGLIKVLGLLTIFAWLGTTPLAAALLPGVDHITQREFDGIRALLDAGEATETLEVKYQRLVQKQVFSDLQKLYDPRNASRLKITYASFEPDLYLDSHGTLNVSSGDDAGFGLHVIKRLELPLADGKWRTIEVNEHWAQERLKGGLFLPDELRVKVQVADGPRRVAGSEKMYLFDSFRLAWGPSREIAILRRSKFDGDAGKKKVMRVPVSAPFSCMGCHEDYSMADYFSESFNHRDEARNYEAIVPDAHYKIPLEKTRGFRQYLTNLRHRHGASRSFVEQVKKDLLDPAFSMEVPGIIPALERMKDSFGWLPEDLPWSRETYSSPLLALQQQATYPFEGLVYLDAIEDYFEGKYRWWDPEIVVPTRSPYR